MSLMRVYKCQCGWSFVLTDAEVFGPIFDELDASCARVMSRAEFVDGYADCQPKAAQESK
jgi:hypothetical protein